MDDPTDPSGPGALARLRSLLSLRRSRLARELDEELDFLLEARVRDLESHGLSSAEAGAEALRRFGDLSTTRQVCLEADRRATRRMLRSILVDEFRQDLSLAVRQLVRRPSLAVPAILTLALGVGAATAIFSVADHVLLRPLPYHDPGRVVVLREVDRTRGDVALDVSPGNFLDWRERASSFQAIGLAEPFGLDLRSPDGHPEAVRAWLVTEEFLPALGLAPMLGRGFVEQDTDEGAEPAVILSHGAWTRRFGADPTLPGRVIDVDGVGARVVGILPPAPLWPHDREVLAPKRFLARELDDRQSRYMYVVARLGPGVTAAQAAADMDGVAAGMAADHPTTNRDSGVQVRTLEQAMLGPVRPALLILLGAVALLLLVACANVAGLLLARGAERETEMAVRAALGAGRGRLARQLVVEGAVLAGAGGIAGVLLARGVLLTLPTLLPPELPRADNLVLDGRILLVALAITAAAALMSGLLPALRISRGLGRALRSGAATADRGRTSLRRAIVAVQVSLATVLLLGGGLLGRSFVTLLSVDPGFRIEGRAAVQLHFWDRNPTPESRVLRREELREAFANTPGVEAVGITTALPLHPEGIDPENIVVVEGRPADPLRPLRVQTLIADAGYFRVLEVPLRSGRMFDDGDRLESPRVVLLNEAAAGHLFPGEDPVGQFVAVGVLSAPVRRQVVGVVANVRPLDLESEPRPELYAPVSQTANAGLTFVVRTRGDAERILPSLREAVWTVDPHQTVHHAMTLEGLLRDTLVVRRFHLFLLGTLSLLSTLLSAVGLYGLVRFAAARRAREMGVRKALGARGSHVASLLLREGVGLAALGVAAGSLVTLALAGILEGLLYGVPARDPVTFLVLGITMVGVAGAASGLPALQAARLDVMRAIRED